VSNRPSSFYKKLQASANGISVNSNKPKYQPGPTVSSPIQSYKMPEQSEMFPSRGPSSSTNTTTTTSPPPRPQNRNILVGESEEENSKVKKLIFMNIKISF